MPANVKPKPLSWAKSHVTGGKDGDIFVCINAQGKDTLTGEQLEVTVRSALAISENKPRLSVEINDSTYFQTWLANNKETLKLLDGITILNELEQKDDRWKNLYRDYLEFRKGKGNLIKMLYEDIGDFLKNHSKIIDNNQSCDLLLLTLQDKTNIQKQIAQMRVKDKENIEQLAQQEEKENEGLLVKRPILDRPILIKIGDEYSIYRDQKGDGSFTLEPISASDEILAMLQSLPFDEGIIKRKDSRFNTPLKTFLEDYHTDVEYIAQHIIENAIHVAWAQTRPLLPGEKPTEITYFWYRHALTDTIFNAMRFVENESKKYPSVRLKHFPFDLKNLLDEFSKQTKSVALEKPPVVEKPEIEQKASHAVDPFIGPYMHAYIQHLENTEGKQGVAEFFIMLMVGLKQQQPQQTQPQPQQARPQQAQPQPQQARPQQAQPQQAQELQEAQSPPHLRVNSSASIILTLPNPGMKKSVQENKAPSPVDKFMLPVGLANNLSNFQAESSRKAMQAQTRTQHSCSSEEVPVLNNSNNQTQSGALLSPVAMAQRT